MDTEKYIWLVLEDGSSYRGTPFGALGECDGQVIFSTKMVGGFDTLAETENAGRIVCLTAPITVNQSLDKHTTQGPALKAAACVIRELCDLKTNRCDDVTIDQWLRDNGVIGIQGVDTRAIVRRLRANGGSMGGRITACDPSCK